MKRIWRVLVHTAFGVVAGCAEFRAQGGSLAPHSFSAAEIQQQRLSPAGEAALRGILDAAVVEGLRRPDFSGQRAAVRKLYERNGYALQWVRRNTVSPPAASLIANLQHAYRKGLRPEDYDGPLWGKRLASLQQATSTAEIDGVNFDVALTVAGMRYVSDLNVGRVDPREVSCDFDIEQNRCDLAEFLSRVAVAQDVDSVLQELEPPFETYRRTQHALETYISLAREYSEGPLSAVRDPVKPGHAYSDLPKLCRLLRRLGDLSGDTPDAGDAVYQESLVSAVKRLQRRHGLEASGWITQETIRALNVPLAQRVRQLELALERLRWVPRQFSQPPVVVNIPEFKLRALDENYKPSLVNNVVVGKAYRHRTPVFAGAIQYVIFRPYWDVPHSITRAELLPKIEKDRRYLAEHDYEIVAAGGRVLDENQTTAEVLQRLRSGELRIRQRPGPNNALGLVKFVFPNVHDVYLHSTPSRELFARPRRDFSHGCIRVESAEELAAWILRAKPGWSIERIRAMMNGTETVRVNLSQPIPVLIFYSTAIAAADGDVYFYPDIYGYDAQLARALENRHPEPK